MYYRSLDSYPFISYGAEIEKYSKIVAKKPILIFKTLTLHPSSCLPPGLLAQFGGFGVRLLKGFFGFARFSVSATKSQDR